ncbi:hypothetical protein BIV57_12430 [Mangrovactinospora gilvigrisea]|uniref:Activator of Hsp90 ATPase homologue 1/2-like C-terminal domain-containing protein n=1 Tax=Mangrovactinospora gilvigrisea TaxID=1428644 RepID=A0A1J7BEM2_9ACTN|nr:hypothetical protein BIV57_12430 [Mangrovactinospora gilvigrisea]
MEAASGGARVLRFVRHHKVAAERVWAAVATEAGLASWLADARLDLRPGGPVELRSAVPNAAGEHPVTHGRTAACERPRLVEYDTAALGRLRFELASLRGGDGDGGSATRLEFSAALLVPGDAAAAEHLLRTRLADWHLHLDLLGEALAGRPFDWSRWTAEGLPRWDERFAFYTSERASESSPGAAQLG